MCTILNMITRYNLYSCTAVQVGFNLKVEAGRYCHLLESTIFEGTLRTILDSNIKGIYVGWVHLLKVQFGYDFEQRYWLVHFLKVQPGYNFEQ